MQESLKSYSKAVERAAEQKRKAKLPELDAWYRSTLRKAVKGREPKHITATELVRLVCLAHVNI